MKPQDVKAALGKRARLPDGTVGRFTAYILRAGEKGLIYQAELQDLTSKRSVRICRLEEVETVD